MILFHGTHYKSAMYISADIKPYIRLDTLKAT